MPAAELGPGRPGLWRHRDFLLLWAGQSVSELGSAVTVLALPLTAVVVLGASTFAVGLLAAATTVPFLIIALPAGLAVDRMAKRGLMIGCDAARMLIIGSVPVAAALGVLTIGQLFAVALATGRPDGLLRRGLPELHPDTDRPRSAAGRQRKARGHPVVRPGGRARARRRAVRAAARAC